jgi:hypothetical protein
MMFDRKQPAEYVLDYLSFRHEKQRYTGRVMLICNPDKGLRLDAFLDQAGPDTRFRDLGIVKMQDRNDQHPVRFRGYGLMII